MDYEDVLYEKNIAIGKRIRFLRRKKGLSQQDLAEKLSVTYQQFQKYETGQNRISAPSLELIVETLGMPISYFFDYKGGEGVVLDSRENKLLLHFQSIKQEILKNHLLQSAVLYAKIR